ncbi:DUF3108 domain-containing protein [Chelativorans sp. Marseille-P2723]|uniref:DUF3108 domain-containing protein n=1 Tax=Chelativorans sp. Marseille-P2723 TaxID=2709133 RepID=UPI00156E9164|nr:DUF3108 domain-containing protein [Chelativorans sp. Marseille-P2723]
MQSNLYTPLRTRGAALRGALAVVLLAAAVSPLSAATQSYQTRYDISLYGLPVGRAIFESRFEGQGFAVSGRFSSAGIARIFDRTDGTVTVMGRFGRGASRPERYTLDYRSGRKKQMTEIRFARDRVAETVNRPELKKRGSDWVPLGQRHLSGVVDPLSALMLPASDPERVCNRTVRVYDGETRADIVLQPAAGSESFAGATITCRARFVPVAGYRKNHSTIRFLRDRGDIRIGFQPVAGGGIYSPVEATIATKVGTVHIKARSM